MDIFHDDEDDFEKLQLYHQHWLDESEINDDIFTGDEALSGWDCSEIFEPNLVADVVPSDDDDFYSVLEDERLIEDIWTSMNNFTIDDPVASSSNSRHDEFEFDFERFASSSNSGNEFEFERFGPSFRGGMEDTMNFIEADESFLEDFLAGLTENADVDPSLIEAVFGLEVKDVGAQKNISDKWSDFGSSVEGKWADNKMLHPLGWEDESLIEDILQAGGTDYEVSSLIDALFSSESNGIDRKKVDSIGDDFIKSFEREEDDVYMIHRKDAMKVIRSAIRHSKAAEDASIKGDNASARKYKVMAKEDWAMAKKLNAEAAKKILSIKNCKNDMWTLDLHGLHAREAVDALRHRLQAVESLPLQEESALVPKINKLGKHKQSCLKAITGKGNHSKGAAVLPSAVRKFLDENGYQFDDSRPGSFVIQPKFCKE